MNDLKNKIVTALEQHSKVVTTNCDETIEYVDRVDFYKIAQEIVKNTTKPDAITNSEILITFVDWYNKKIIDTNYHIYKLYLNEYMRKLKLLINI